MLAKGPVIIGHSFRGLMTQILAGRVLAAASVAISPTFRRIVPLFVSGAYTLTRDPFSKLVVVLRPASSAAQRNPATKHRAVPLRYDEFRHAFANAVDEDQAKRLYEQFCVPAPARETFRRSDLPASGAREPGLGGDA